MSIEEDAPEGATTPPPPAASSVTNSPVPALMVVGTLLVVVGIVSGSMLAVQVSPDGCEEQFQSCGHPHAAFGVVLIGASLFAGVLLALVGIVARRVVAYLPPRHD